MPITIEQIEKLDDDLGGNRKYLLRINRKKIGTFIHTRSDGLATCLRKAAQAAESTEFNALDRFLRETSYGD